MTEQTGSRLIREVIRHFRDAAAECAAPEVGNKLKKLADELDGHAERHYWKTHKGIHELEALLEEVDDLRAALAACEDDDASQTFCTIFFNRLEHLIEHVKTAEAHE